MMRRPLPKPQRLSATIQRSKSGMDGADLPVWPPKTSLSISNVLEKSRWCRAARVTYDPHRQSRWSIGTENSNVPHDSPHFHTTPKVSANTGSSASMTVNRSISGNSRASGILGIRS